MSVDCDIDRSEETPHSLIAPIYLRASFTASVLSSLNERLPLLGLSATVSWHQIKQLSNMCMEPCLDYSPCYIFVWRLLHSYLLNNMTE